MQTPRIRCQSVFSPVWDESHRHGLHENDWNKRCFHCWKENGHGFFYDKNGHRTDFEWADTIAKYPASLLGGWKYPANRAAVDQRDYDSECGRFADQAGVVHARPVNYDVEENKLGRFAPKQPSRPTKHKPATKAKKVNTSMAISSSSRSAAATRLREVGSNAKRGAVQGAQLAGAKTAMNIAHHAVLEAIQASAIPAAWKMGALVVVDNDYGKAAVGIVAGTALPFVAPYLPEELREIADVASRTLFARSTQLVFENWGDKIVGGVSATLQKMAPSLGVEVKQLTGDKTEGFVAPARETAKVRAGRG